jgi:hypothetical protein
MPFLRKLGLVLARIHPAINRFMRQFEGEVVQRSIELAIHMTSSIKIALKSETVTRAVELTQTDVDNKTRDIMLMVLDTNLHALTMMKGCYNLPTADERLKCYMGWLKEMADNDANDELRKLAVLMASHMAMGWKVAISSRNFWNLAVELYLWIKKRV